MRRYFFNVRDGVSHPDTLGHEFATVDAARTAAIRFAADVMRDEVASLLRGEDWRVELTDRDGAIHFTIVVATVRG